MFITQVEIIPSMKNLHDKVKAYENFPKEGILFQDISPIFLDPSTTDEVMSYFSVRYKGRKIDKVAGIESRGFILGAMLAQKLGVGFALIRKANKLPGEKERLDYNLEYGTNSIEIQRSAILPGERVLIIDDVLATGGTAKAAIKLVESVGGAVVECGFLLGIKDLNGLKDLDGYDTFVLLEK
jgi:adenine phosphoribosyltransferase